MLFERPEIGESAVLVSVLLKKSPGPDLEELKELTESASIQVAASMQIIREKPNPKFFIGKGKLDDLKSLIREFGAHLVIINNNLSAGQQRNLEKELDCRVVTRTELILMIFADRALSHEGQLQVELAQLKHAQTRLVKGWTHLDRQKGGIGVRGAGEKQVELDRRMLSDRVKVYEKKLDQISKNRKQNRRLRQSNKTPTVALVGYTNAGKSTLFNALSGADALVENRLFATLDPLIRRLQIPGLRESMIADTVGFVSQLPHQLVEAFHATLEEVLGSNLLLHVVDVSDPNYETRIDQVREVVVQIGASKIPELLVFNKVDLVEISQRSILEKNLGVCVSAKELSGLEGLRARIASVIGVTSPYKFLLEPSDGATRAWLYRSGAVLKEDLQENGKLAMTLRADEMLLKELRMRRQR